MTSARLNALLLAAGLFVSGAVHAEETRALIESELGKPVVRGGIVYKSYCALCHGQIGDGVGRASKLYSNMNLAIKPATREEYEQIIRQGGEASGKSPSMPPWQNELSDEQIRDVVAYLLIVSDAVKRGQVVFKTNCILCHGVNADGKGRAARIMNPPPADLTRSDKNDLYKEMIITMGGEAMGRSPQMPVWGQQLSTQEIKDVISYLRTVLVVPPPPPPGG
jgi:cytochrome c oxidase cbb3-type subunit 3